MEFGFATGSDADGLDAFFARRGIVETEEGLVGLDAVSGFFVDDLEGDFEGVGGVESYGCFGFVCEGESRGISVGLVRGMWL